MRYNHHKMKEETNQIKIKKEQQMKLENDHNDLQNVQVWWITTSPFSLKKQSKLIWQRTREI